LSPSCWTNIGATEQPDLAFCLMPIPIKGYLHEQWKPCCDDWNQSYLLSLGVARRRDWPFGSDGADRNGTPYFLLTQFRNSMLYFSIWYNVM
jgi:hypothetical protein